MEKEIKAIIKEVVEGLMEKMGIEGEVEVREIVKDEKDATVCNINTDQSSYLIGQYGVNLQALQHLARVIIRRKNELRTDFILDVNSYRQEKNESIISMAKNMAEKAISEKRSIILRPMSPYERRLVHMELSRNSQIKTESIGEGDERRIAIHPVSL